MMPLPTSILKDNLYDYETIKNFVINNAFKTANDLPAETRVTNRESVAIFIAKHIQSLSGEPFSSLNLMDMDFANLIKIAFYLVEYQGLLLLGQQENYKELFENNYLEFSELFEVNVCIANGNIFAFYLQLLKLSRKIHDLCDKDNFNSLTPEGRGDELSKYMSELAATLSTINNVEVPETKFWTTALAVVGIRTIAAAKCIVENSEIYDLAAAKILLEKAYRMCLEGTELTKTAHQRDIDLYTLKESLLSTLPYQSYQAELNNIYDLPYWSNEERLVFSQI